jgi:signal transduction histidine kinase
VPNQPAPDRLLAIAAHDLRNLLAPMRYITRIVRRECTAPAATSQLAKLDELVTLVMQLLDQTLVAHSVLTRTLVADFQNTELGGIIESAISRTRSVIDLRQQVVHVTVQPRPLPMTGDPERLALACAILLDNAARYAPPASSIRIDATATDDAVVIRVSDDGPGIPPQLAGELFTMLAGRELPDHGLGVGLAVARHIAELHGGTLEAAPAATGAELVMRLARWREPKRNLPA